MSAVRPSSSKLLKRKRSSSEQVVPGSSNFAVNDGTIQHRNVSNDGTNGDSRSTFTDPNYPIPDFDKVYAKMRHPVDGINVADRRWRLITYPKCFVGTHAVDWMTQNIDIDRPTAVNFGIRLMNAGIITHVTQSEPFADGYFFFRFQEDDESNVLNMKRVWDANIETRPAVPVSQELLTQLACLCEEYRERFIASKSGRDSNDKSESLDNKASEQTSSPSPAHAQGANSGLASGFLTSPLLGALPRNVINTLAPYTAMAGSPNLNKHQNVSTRKTNSESGDDIDFSLLAKSEAFRQYTLAAAELQRVQLVGLSHDEMMAFFVNLYNTICLHAYVVHGPPNNFWRRWIFFRSLSYRVAGLDMSLDDIEHGILRGNKRHPTIMLMQQLRPSDPKCQFVLTSRDGRIHFVISAGTRSDPPVRILNGENLQEELHEATVEFLGCSVKVDITTKIVTLPRIFLWYADDFPTPEKELLRWVSRFLPVERSDQLLALLEDEVKPTVSYKSFDWNNAEARFEAVAIRRKRRRLLKQCVSQGGQNTSNQFTFAPSTPVSSARDLERMLTTPLLGSHPLLAAQSAARPELSQLPAVGSINLQTNAVQNFVPEDDENRVTKPSSDIAEESSVSVKR